MIRFNEEVLTSIPTLLNMLPASVNVLTKYSGSFVISDSTSALVCKLLRVDIAR